MANKVWIPGYTKDDGTKVKGHYRTISRKNANGGVTDKKTAEAAVNFAKRKLTDAKSIRKGRAWQEKALKTQFPSLSPRQIKQALAAGNARRKSGFLE